MNIPSTARQPVYCLPVFPKLRRELQPGDRIGPYIVDSRLAVGGMAEVFAARDSRNSAPVALKRCMVKSSSTHRALEMFEREARIALVLAHPHIVSTYGLIEDEDGNPVLVMELLDGAPVNQLATRIHDGDDGIWLASEVVRKAALALDHLHRIPDPDTKLPGLIHRDVSPDNIFVTRDGVVKLLDFGLAKRAEDDRLTQTGVLKGKAAFMSPEQIAGERLDARSDQYSLATTLYWLWCGVCPFERQTVVATLDAIRSDPLLRPSSLEPRIPRAADDAMARALALDAANRFPSCTAFVDAIQSSLPSVPSSRAPPLLAAHVRSDGVHRASTVLFAQKWSESDADQTAPNMPVVDGDDLRQRRIRGTSEEEDTIVEPSPMQSSPSIESVTSDPAIPMPVSSDEPISIPSASAVLVEPPPSVITANELEPQPTFVEKIPPVRLGRPDVGRADVGRADGARADGGRPLATGAPPPAERTFPLFGPNTDPPPLAQNTLDGLVPSRRGPLLAALAVVAAAGLIVFAMTRAQDLEPAPPPPPPPPPPTAAPPTTTPPPVAAPQKLRLVAPPHIEWRAGDKNLGSGTLEAEIASGIRSVDAVDTKRGVSTTFPVAERIDYFKLKKVPVHILVRPWAEVTLGSDKLGTTPLKPILLVPGTYTLRLVHGKEEQLHAIEVANEPLELRYRF